MAFWNRSKPAPAGPLERAGIPKGPWRDGMENILSGMGTDRDKTTGTQFTLSLLNDQQLSFAYRGDWIARKIVNAPAQDSTRAWRSFQAEKKDITIIEEIEDTLGLQRKIKLGLQLGRLYGGGALIMGINQGNIDKEVNLKTLGKDSLKFVHVVSKNELGCGPIDWNIDSPYYGEPSYYTRTVGAQEKIHPSRVVRLLGNENPNLTEANGWSDSVLQVVAEAVQHVGVVTNGTALMVQESKIDIVKIPQLMLNMGNKDYETRLKTRFGIANIAKSLYSTLLLDAEEEWERIGADMSGLPDIVKVYLLIASGAADIPVTRMLGQSPAGLSATGESDIRNYYDRLSGEQNTVLRPAMERLDQVLLRSAFGSMDESIFYEWDSLWQMTDAEKAEIAGKKATVFKTDVDAGLIPPEVLREARINQLIEDGFYPGLEQELEAANHDPSDPVDVPIEVDPNTPPASPGGATPANGKVPKETGEKQAVGDIATRVRKKLPVKRTRARAKLWSQDATPRTLYVRRDLVSVAPLRKWAKDNGLNFPDDPHVTICYSRKAVDWNKAGEAWGQDENGNLRVPPGGMRMVDKLGTDAIVLMFASSALSYRHCDLISRLEAQHDYPDYQPHVTVGRMGDNANWIKIEPFDGELVFGPEIFQEIKP